MPSPPPGHYAVPTNIPTTQIDYVTPNKPYPIYPSKDGTQSCITLDNNVEIAFPSPYDYKYNRPYGDGFQCFGIHWKVVHPKDLTVNNHRLFNTDNSHRTKTKKPPSARDPIAHDRINELTERVSRLEQPSHLWDYNPEFFQENYMQKPFPTTKPPRTWPYPNDKYYFITSEGNISYARWKNHPSDINRRDFLGIFRTYDEAKDQIEELKSHPTPTNPHNQPPTVRRRKHTLSPADGWPQPEDTYFWVSPERIVHMSYWKNHPLDHQRDFLYGIYPTRWAAEKAWGLSRT